MAKRFVTRRNKIPPRQQVCRKQRLFTSFWIPFEISKFQLTRLLARLLFLLLLSGWSVGCGVVVFSLTASDCCSKLLVRKRDTTANQSVSVFWTLSFLLLLSVPAVLLFCCGDVRLNFCSLYVCARVGKFATVDFGVQRLRVLNDRFGGEIQEWFVGSTREMWQRMKPWLLMLFLFTRLHVCRAPRPRLKIPPPPPQPLSQQYVFLMMLRQLSLVSDCTVRCVPLFGF